MVTSDIDTGEDFYMDGHYFIAPNTIPSKETEKDYKDVWVESMHFLDESLLLVVTNTRTVRVLYTQKFVMGEFKSSNGLKANWNKDETMDTEKEAMEYVAHSKSIFKQIESLDSRAKAMPQGRPLTKE